MGELLHLRLGELAVAGPVVALALAIIVPLWHVARRRRPIPTEPSPRQRSLRADMGYLILSPVAETFGRSLTTLCLAGCALAAGHSLGPDVLRGFGPVTEQPRWLIIIEVLLLGDFMFYWTHRMAHTLPWLWRLHAIHHSTRHLRALSALRLHPGEAYAQMLQIVPLYFLGFPVDTLGPVLPLAMLYALYIHSNLNVSLGPLRFVINSPAYHRWHHSLDAPLGVTNYAGWFPIFDIVFGTYEPRTEPPAALGIDEPDMPETCIGQLVHPFRRRPERSARWNVESARTL